MFISRQKKEENIIEYMLYMWQIEDIVRSCNFNIDIISENVIDKIIAGRSEKEEVRKWYLKIISSMEQENILQKGHMEELNYIRYELSFLHNSLVNVFQDKKYIGLFNWAHPNISALQKKTGGANPGEVETCLTGLYGFLFLKLQKKKISADTTEAMKTISNLMSFLAHKYKEMKKGDLRFPEEIKN